MSVVVWRIAIDARTYPADDLSGAGARLTGGRWNEPDIPLVYASASRALACLETVVHLNAGGLPLNRYLVEVTIPASVWDAREEADLASLVGWDARPASLTSVRFGTQWARSLRTPILLVPSAVVPEESNALINPLHPASASVGGRKVRRWTFDPRMGRAR